MSDHKAIRLQKIQRYIEHPYEMMKNITGKTEKSGYIKEGLGIDSVRSRIYPLNTPEYAEHTPYK